MPRWEDWLFAQKPGFWGELARAPFWALSGIYWLGVKARLRAYQKGFFSSEKLEIPIISVGNLTLGGTGKTPLVIWLAEKFSGLGLMPAVSIRGYGGKGQKSLTALTPGSKSSPALVGDEALLIFQKLKKVPVLVGKNRVEAGKKARELGAELLILDDGFQHLCLKRDLDLVLIDGRRSIFEEKLFPRGRLREPVSELRRAEVLILSRAEELEPDWIALLKDFHPQAKIFKLRYQVKNSEELAGKRAFAFAGIADPQDFFQLAQRVKINLVGSWSFSDHHFYKPEELRQMEKQAKEKGAEILLTTEKDAVRLEGFEPALPLKTLEIQLDFFGEEEELLEFLLSCLSREGKDAQGN